MKSLQNRNVQSKKMGIKISLLPVCGSAEFKLARQLIISKTQNLKFYQCSIAFHCLAHVDGRTTFPNEKNFGINGRWHELSEIQT